MPTSLSSLVAVRPRLGGQLAPNVSIDELFEGQLLANGWVTGGEQTADQRDALRNAK